MQGRRELIVGIDAGGTKTHARAFTLTGAPVAAVELDGIDLPVVGEQESWRLLAALRARLEALLPPGGTVVKCIVGAPGYGELTEWTSSWDSVVGDALRGWRPSVHNDVRLAFFSAFPDSKGILVLAGTGSMAWGGDGRGSEVRCGGWGHWFGDEGSAFDIGRAALRAAACSLDGRGPTTSLAERIPIAFDATDLWTVVGSLSVSPATQRQRIAGLASLVDEAASAADGVAVELLTHAGEQLARHAITLWERLSRPETSVHHAGGVFRSATVLTRFRERLIAQGMSVAGLASIMPVTGAVALARHEEIKGGHP